MSFQIIPGDTGSPVVIHVPHSSTYIPEDVRAGIVLDDAALAVQLAAITDADTDLIAIEAVAATRVRPWLFINRTSRLVIDPERFPDEREELNAVGMGAVYERTTTGEILRQPSAEQRDSLLSTYFHPYSDALSRLVRERLDALGEVLIIDLHSYPLQKNPYELHGDGERPEVCIGTDAVHTSSELALRVHKCFANNGRSVEFDSPFRGTYVPLFAYDAKDSRVQSVMVELRRDVVAQYRSGLASSLREFINGV
ncbi:N-formylglutamate amidohydrolase [Smaragdicoccus niigatensis]|uniref:N-formylglutamate amidohydrolase n=1 Tax=Smaragdicoccus niigatensis TaxID=359359 RepID=UPI0009DC39FF|nr:N-formylglutamate amidohydrolase [Smaragdicoccus niigatensis]